MGILTFTKFFFLIKSEVTLKGKEEYRGKGEKMKKFKDNTRTV